MAREPVFRGKQADAKNALPLADAGNSADSGSVKPHADLEDTRYDDELRPQKLIDVVGQRKALARLEIMLDAAKKRKEPLGHLLFDGPPGLGKTTLATVIPKELGTELQIASGPSLSAPKDL
jgi:Holliday junction DNA helicase RuvB